MRSVLLILLAFVMVSCFDQKPGKATLKNSPSTTVIRAVISQDGQETSGTLSASSGEIQTLSAPEGSAISGVLSSFPPGSISIDTEITLSPGADITDANDLKSVGLSDDNKVQSVGSAVSIESSVAFNTSVPFTVAISIGSQSLLLQDQFNSYAVVYKVKDVDTNTLKFGIIPANEIVLSGGKASFTTQMFGTFQLVKTIIPIVVRQEAVVATLIADKPAEIDEVVPFIADGGREITMKGAGFTGKMLVTVAGIPVRRLNVKSDVQATFIVPDNVPFGFTTVDANQAGVKTSYQLLARSADKLSLPLITMDPSGVCEGVNYYDANGVQQIGTKSCAAAANTNAATADKAKVADTAAYANFAASAAEANVAVTAQEAEFARGKKGPTLTASSSVTIPANGDFFDISGSATIQNFGIGVEGQVIKLRFLQELVVTGSKVSPKLALKDDLPFVSQSGLILELIGTSNGWTEIGRSTLEDAAPVFLGIMSTNGIDHTFQGNGHSGYQSLVFDNVIVDPSYFIFDSSSNLLTSIADRKYKIEMSFGWDEVGTVNSKYFNCMIGLEYSSSPLTQAYGMSSIRSCKYPSYSGSTVYTDTRMFLSTSSFRPYYMMQPSDSTPTDSTPTGTFRLRSKPGHSTFIRITPQ
jgi:hypothetical protein